MSSRHVLYWEERNHRNGCGYTSLERKSVDAGVRLADLAVEDACATKTTGQNVKRKIYPDA